MANVKIYSSDYCPYCIRAKRLLDGKKQAYEEIKLVIGGDEMNALIKETGMKTVPQIFINEKLIGGFSELSALEKQGELDKLLAQ